MIELLALAVLLLWLAIGLITAVLVGRSVKIADNEERIANWRRELNGSPVQPGATPAGAHFTVDREAA